MRSIEIARKLAENGQKADAQNAYFLALGEVSGQDPELELEAASYLFFSEGDYRAAYTTFVSLYNRGYYREELMNLMIQAFYLPNVETQKKHYRENARLLGCYPYFFHKEFPEFDELPILFFPFDDKGFLPFYRAENRFGDYINLNDTIVDQYFFKDLENPILAKDVYSQYQLEYLNDNVRKSEWVGRENHIYLHYTNWPTFCAYLQVLSFRKLVKEQKLVFLIEDEVAQYPIDFKARFGIDYSQYPVKPVGIREINRLIWHTQLSTHNGGDFFNEILDGHPNLLTVDSLMFSNVKEAVEGVQKALRSKKGQGILFQKLRNLHHITEKDCLVGLFLYTKEQPGWDRSSRIVPALLFQPHFKNMVYQASLVNAAKNWTTLSSEQYEEIRTSPIFLGFKYIKTFTPMRRITTSYAASHRFMVEYNKKEQKETPKGLPDVMMIRLSNRSFMVDPWDRLYRDSRLVRFEDGKLNPKATFTALAKFLDIPYTQSMTYCSMRDIEHNTPAVQGNVGGFDPATVYRTYDDYASDDERAFLEYFFRDAYAEYGYDFQYYHGEPVDDAWIEDKLTHFTCMERYFRAAWMAAMKKENEKNMTYSNESLAEEVFNRAIDALLEQCRQNERLFVSYLEKGLRFINPQGQPLRFMKQLELDPQLLEQPLYH